MSLHNIFITGQYKIGGDFDPHKLTDEELEQHIERVFKQLNSISSEWQTVWNHPRKAQEQQILRDQFLWASAELEYATQVWETRQITMR